MITCSITGISNSLPTSMIFFVKILSSSLSVGMPVGWLWTSATGAARILTAGQKISRGVTRVAVKLPLDILLYVRMAFLRLDGQQEFFDFDGLHFFTD